MQGRAHPEKITSGFLKEVYPILVTITSKPTFEVLRLTFVAWRSGARGNKREIPTSCIALRDALTRSRHILSYTRQLHTHDTPPSSSSSPFFTADAT